ncbi:thioredoxin [Longispora sp. NPDC051575]|uniref:thioredoxin n=1 Tax=Longispora sp. NPDC051575 TaxID=3154943 RepID=UPI00342F6295
MKAVTDASFVADVLESETPVLVDFWAEWCAPCKKVSPVLAELSEEFGDKLTIVKVDGDANPGVMRDYKVMSLPTLTIFKGGKPVQSMIGAHPKSKIKTFIEEAI